MSSDTLVLFCGGSPVYGGLPKPLQVLPSGETLLEHYIACIENLPKKIILLIEQAFQVPYREVIKTISAQSLVSLVICADSSSTLDKLNTFFKSSTDGDITATFSYPDMFIIGSLIKPSIADNRFEDSVFISFAPVTSRFPRLIVDNYDGSVYGISNHSSSMPANPMHVFGGHIVARTSVIEGFLNAFLNETKLLSPTLEFDFFFWLINRRCVFSMPINGRWIQADSPRDISNILAATRVDAYNNLP